MKTILVPTDYSEVARNAMQYAAELAKFENAKLVLFHAYKPRVLLSSLTLMDGGFEEESMEMLRKCESDIRKSLGDLPEIELVTRFGFVVEEILDIIKERKIDLVVMGVTGAGRVKETLMGSTATTVMQKTNVPVLIVPPTTRFKVPEKIALALESNVFIHAPIREKIKYYVKKFDARLMLFNMVLREEPAVYGKESDEELYLDHAFGDMEYELCLRSGEDLVEGLNAFIDSRGVDMLMMIPHAHKQLFEVFLKSNTKKMAFHTHIPLLSIHE